MASSGYANQVNGRRNSMRKEADKFLQNSLFLAFSLQLEIIVWMQPSLIAAYNNILFYLQVSGLCTCH